MTESFKQKFSPQALLPLQLVMAVNHAGALNSTWSSGTIVPWWRTTTPSLQSSWWVSSRVECTAIGPAKTRLSTFYYVLCHAHQPNCSLCSEWHQRQMWVGTNPCPFLTLNAWSKSPHSENHSTSMGGQSHCKNEPRQFTRQPCPHQMTSHLNGRCCK